MPGSGTETSRRRRRHREMFAFSAMRTTQTSGQRDPPGISHEAHARAKASAAKLLRGVLVTDADQDRAQALIPGHAVEVGEVWWIVFPHSSSTHNQPTRDYPAGQRSSIRRPASPGSRRSVQYPRKALSYAISHVARHRRSRPGGSQDR